MSDIKQGLREFISAEMKWDGATADLTDDYQLLEREVVDSLGIFKIISFLENEYDIIVEDDDLVPENFNTIASISELAGSKA